MARYIVRRLAWAIVVLFAVAVLTFAIAYLIPTDPARAIAGIRSTEADVARIRHALGLDQPVWVQFVGYLARLLQGDFGHSYQQQQEVLGMMLARLPATVELALGGIVIELAIGIPLGILAARHRGSVVDRFATVLTSLLLAMPAFLVGYVLLYLLAFRPQLSLGFELFPIGGFKLLDLRYLFLPALALGFTGAAYYARLCRLSVLEQLDHDYVRTARAKGLSENAVVNRHVFRNILPVITSQFGLDLGLFLGGVVVIEAVFSWPGIGRLAYQSVVTLDIPVIMGTVLLGTICIVVANLIVDIAYVFIDPRVKY